jgi:hypothetical protein
MVVLPTPPFWFAIAIVIIWITKIFETPIFGQKIGQSHQCIFVDVCSGGFVQLQKLFRNI